MGRSKRTGRPNGRPVSPALRLAIQYGLHRNQVVRYGVERFMALGEDARMVAVADMKRTAYIK